MYFIYYLIIYYKIIDKYLCILTFTYFKRTHCLPDTCYVLSLKYKNFLSSFYTTICKRFIRIILAYYYTEILFTH